MIIQYVSFSCCLLTSLALFFLRFSSSSGPMKWQSLDKIWCEPLLEIMIPTNLIPTDSYRWLLHRKVSLLSFIRLMFLCLRNHSGTPLCNHPFHPPPVRSIQANTRHKCSIRWCHKRWSRTYATSVHPQFTVSHFKRWSRSFYALEHVFFGSTNSHSSWARSS